MKSTIKAEKGSKKYYKGWKEDCGGKVKQSGEIGSVKSTVRGESGSGEIGVEKPADIASVF